MNDSRSNPANHTRLMSHTSRPLRQPLPSSRSPAPVYGRIGSRHPNSGGSLPIFPTQPKVGVSSQHSFLGSRGKASDPPSTATTISRRTPSRSLSETVKPTQRPLEPQVFKREPKQDAPAAAEPKSLPLIRNAEPDGVRSCEVVKSNRVIRAPPTMTKKGVHFNSVQVHYEESADRAPLLLSLDQYERQRGPTRPPKFFQKSEVELRSIRRLRQIEDSRADEEWKAIREASSVIRAGFEEPPEEQVDDMEVYGDLAQKIRTAQSQKKGNRISRFFRGKKRSALLVDL